MNLTEPTPEHGRRAADFYPTPAWCTEAVLPFVLRRCPPAPGRGYVLEPGCGEGAIALPLALAGYHVRGVDIRPECERPDAVVEGAPPGGSYGAWVKDYMGWWPHGLGWRPPMAIVGNPPYSIAMEFINHSMGLLDDVTSMGLLDDVTSGPGGALRVGRGSLLCFLLTLDYLATQGRAAFWREHPADVLVLDRRPSFTGGGTASTNYGWFMWPPVNGVRGQVYRVGDLG